VKRVIALVGAAVMILVSLAIRAAIDDDSDSTSSSSGPVTIACIPELEAHCRELHDVTVTIQDAATTARDIADGTAAIDGWVTFDPWPEMAAQLAQHSIAKKTTSLASSELVIAAVRERATALAPLCGGTVTWKCLGDNNGKQWADVGGRAEWGTLKAGVPPLTSATGVLVLGNATSSYFGRTDFAANDFADDQFTVWKTNLLRFPGTFADFINFFPAQLSAVGAVQALSDPGARANEVTFIDQGMSATAVVADLTGRGGRVAGDLQQKLKSSGWSDPRPSGLPDAGVLVALTSTG
jgi:hypothetical protein